MDRHILNPNIKYNKHVQKTYSRQPRPAGKLEIGYMLL